MAQVEIDRCADEQGEGNHKDKRHILSPDDLPGGEACSPTGVQPVFPVFDLLLIDEAYDLDNGAETVESKEDTAHLIRFEAVQMGGTKKEPKDQQHLDDVEQGHDGRRRHLVDDFEENGIQRIACVSVKHDSASSAIGRRPG